ncbi:Abi family protein [Deinococcus sp. VB343]|uniref:Abi family protein n=1 Tax=Deinococcus sp. VB343 TaxID=3385567 RepID=UPI0039C9BD51
MTIYNKPPLTLPDQVSHLQARGLHIPDPAHAQQTLKRVGLYRFKGYLLPYKSATGYTPGLTFDDIEQLIAFDDALRLHIFGGLQTVEIGIRQLINQHMLEHYGIRWYANPLLFRPADRYFSHTDFLAKAIREFHKMPDLFVGHYRRAYEARAYPPAWMIAETMSMGSWSKLYRALAQQRDKDAIALPLGVRATTLENWLQDLTVLRNACAHHSRIYDRVSKPAEVVDDPLIRAALMAQSFEAADPRSLRLAPRLYALHRLTRALNPHTRWTDRLKALLAPTPAPLLARVGFRPSWATQPEWI